MIMNLLFLLVVLLMIFLLLSALSAKGKRSNIEFPFQSKVDLFTPAERSFLGVLEQVLGDQYRVMGKVRLCDVIDIQNTILQSHQMQRLKSQQNSTNSATQFITVRQAIAMKA